MDNITNSTLQNQTDFTDEIRRRCRVAVEHFGGIRKFAGIIGEDEGRWFNRLTEGRVVGFDVAWLMRVLLTTEDPNIIAPFFMRNGRVNIKAISKLCKILNHVVLPIFKSGNTDNDSTKIIISNLLRASQKILENSKGGGK